MIDQFAVFLGQTRSGFVKRQPLDEFHPVIVQRTARCLLPACSTLTTKPNSVTLP